MDQKLLGKKEWERSAFEQVMFLGCFISKVNLKKTHGAEFILISKL